MSKKRLSEKPSGRKRKFLLSAFIILISSALVLSGLFFSVSLFLKNRRNAQFYYEVTEIDRLIDKGKLVDASARFRLISAPPAGLENGMIYLKRSWQIAEGLKDYSLMLNAAHVVWDDEEPYQEVAALYVYALLRSGNHSKAFKMAGKYLRDSRYSSLVAEAYIKASSAALLPGSDAILSDEDRTLLDIRDFSEENTDKLISIYRGAVLSSNDIRLVKNLVLLYCAQGRFDEAWKLTVERLRSDAPELYLQVAYDSRQYEEALSVIDRLEGELTGEALADLLLVKADILLLRNNKLGALSIYQSLIEDAPEYSVIPYRNLIPIAFQLNAAQRVKMELEDKDLLEFYEPLFADKDPYSDPFTGEVELVLLYAELLKRTERIDEAAGFLKRYIYANEGNPELELMLHQLVDSSRSDLFISQLQYLMQKDPGNELIPQTLCYYLKAFPDRRLQLRNTLSLAQQNFHDRQWIDFYRAWLYLLEDHSGAYLSAAEIFQNLLNRRPRWEYAANAAEIYCHLSKTSEAERLAGHAETLLMGDPSRTGEKFGDLKRLQGWIYEKSGDSEDAILAYESAIVYDPANIDAILALKKLQQTHSSGDYNDTTQE